MKMQKMRQSPQVLIDSVQIKHYLQEKKLLQEKREKSILKKIPVIEEDVGYFISLACVLNQPKQILEIGCGTGYSTYFLLKNLYHKFSYTGIDLNKKRISEAEGFIKSILKKKSYLSGNLRFINGNAIKIIPALEEKFDLVFIDAAKFEYLEYIKSVKEKLNKNAVVIADNIFYKDRVFSKKISKHDHKSINGLRSYIEFITRSNLFNNYFFNIGDGIVLSKYMKTEK